MNPGQLGRSMLWNILCDISQSLLSYSTAAIYHFSRCNWPNVLQTLLVFSQSVWLSFALLFLSKVPARTVNKHAFGLCKNLSVRQLWRFGVWEHVQVAVCVDLFSHYIFLGVHPWDKRAVQNCFHSITLSACLQHSDGLQRELCAHRAAVFALSVHNAASSIRWRLETRQSQRCGGEPRSLRDCYLSVLLEPLIRCSVTERCPIVRAEE